MTHEKLIKTVERFGQSTWVAIELWDNNKSMAEEMIKSQLVYAVNKKGYKIVSEPEVFEFGFLKFVEDDFISVFDKAEADAVEIRSVVNVIRKELE